MRWSLLGDGLAMGGGLTAAVGACSSAESMQALTGGTAGSDGAGGSGGTAGSAGGAGLSRCGPLEQVWGDKACVAKLVPVSGGYSIDATEVTRNQYAAWLATGPSRLGQDSYCAWNSSFTPRCEWPPGMKGAHPVVCVDWCDAYAYCRGVGKLLCGSRAGGPSGYDDYADATKSRWQDACSSGGAHMYPYGGGGAAGTIGYQATTCNGADNGKGTTLPVGTCPGCVSSESGYGGVYDLSGNVWEWEDSCGTQGGNAAYCRARGGSFQGSYGYLRCAYGYAVNRSGSYDSVGFRCCSR